MLRCSWSPPFPDFRNPPQPSIAAVFATRAGFFRGTSEDVEFLEPLERRIQPGDSVFVFPYLPVLYPLLDAHNPTRFLYLQPGMMTAADEREAVRELEAARPRWVVTADLRRKPSMPHGRRSDPALIPMQAMHAIYWRTIGRWNRSMASGAGWKF